MLHTFQQRWPRMVSLALALAFSFLLLVACGGKHSVASRSANAYLDAKKKGVVVSAEGHGGGKPSAPAAGAMDMPEMNSPADASMSGMDDSKMNTSGGSMTGMDHSKMKMSGSSSMAGMDQTKMNASGSMAGMDHSKMKMSSSSMAGTDQTKMNMPGASMTGMDHSKMKMSGSSSMAGMDQTKMNMPGGSMAMDHSKMNMSGGGAVTPLPTASEAEPGQPAATLRAEALDRPAATSIEDAQRSAEMSQSMAGGDMMMPADYRQYDAGRGEAAPAQQGGAGDPSQDMPASGSGMTGMSGGARSPGPSAAAAPPPPPAANSSGRRKSGGGSRTSPSAEKKPADVYYCPMHPDVTSDKPGKDPKCGMALVKKKEKK